MTSVNKCKTLSGPWAATWHNSILQRSVIGFKRICILLIFIINLGFSKVNHEQLLTGWNVVGRLYGEKSKKYSKAIFQNSLEHRDLCFKLQTIICKEECWVLSTRLPKWADEVNAGIQSAKRMVPQSTTDHVRIRHKLPGKSSSHLSIKELAWNRN